MIDFTTYFALFLIILMPLGVMFSICLSKKDRQSKRVKSFPFVVALLAGGISFGANKIGLDTLSQLEKMEEAALNNKTFKENDFFFAFSEELDIIRDMNKGLGKLAATLKLAPATWGWSPITVDLQVSAIQAIQVCYPKKWQVLKSEMFTIPMDKQAVKSRLKEEFKSEAFGESQVFCQFETVLKLI